MRKGHLCWGQILWMQAHSWWSWKCSISFTQTQKVFNWTGKSNSTVWFYQKFCDFLSCYGNYLDLWNHASSSTDNRYKINFWPLPFSINAPGRRRQGSLLAADSMTNGRWRHTHLIRLNDREECLKNTYPYRCSTTIASNIIPKKI